MTEEWYDDVIAPKLLEVSKLCEAKGCALVAVVEYAPEKRGSTLYTPPGCGLAMILLRALDKCDMNIDAFVISVLRYCKANNLPTGASIVLSQWGSTSQPLSSGDKR